MPNLFAATRASDIQFVPLHPDCIVEPLPPTTTTTTATATVPTTPPAAAAAALPAAIDPALAAACDAKLLDAAMVCCAANCWERGEACQHRRGPIDQATWLATLSAVLPDDPVSACYSKLTSCKANAAVARTKAVSLGDRVTKTRAKVEQLERKLERFRAIDVAQGAALMQLIERYVEAQAAVDAGMEALADAVNAVGIDHIHDHARGAWRALRDKASYVEAGISATRPEWSTAKVKELAYATVRELQRQATTTKECPVPACDPSTQIACPPQTPHSPRAGTAKFGVATLKRPRRADRDDVDDDDGQRESQVMNSGVTAGVIACR